MINLDNAWNMYIFRDGKRSLSAPRLVAELRTRLENRAGVIRDHAGLIDVLLRAGELECALADEGSPFAMANITDDLAAALVSGSAQNVHELVEQLSALEVPAMIQVAPPEGFAYYALHPLDFAELVRDFPLGSPHVAVIGIRSIGTTLSAVVTAALRVRGLNAERITVRPTGHPFQRKVGLDYSQRKWVRKFLAQDAEFLIADEGPGMSGSSFLSVASALMEAGVDRERITFLCTREPDPATLTAPDAATRWPSFRAMCTGGARHLPKDAKEYIAGGIWRAQVFESEDQWPASWLQMERLKFLSEDGRTVYRFEGFGRFGQEVHDRARAVAEAGFGPMPHGREEGFGVYPTLRGRSLSSQDVTEAVLSRIAEYCAFRARKFRVDSPETSELEVMSRHNVQQEFGIDLPDDFRLPCGVPIICDGRMHPHNWIDTGSELLKVDNATHGDDHFFPGATDIAWDLGGTIVEWDLSDGQQSAFLKKYRVASGESVGDRIAPYLLAYSIFRMAYCKMAAASMGGSGEGNRLSRDVRRYGAHAKWWIEALAARAGLGRQPMRARA